MHDALRRRVLRKLETLPEAQLYQVLDYIEFLETRYAREGTTADATGLQRLAEKLEDGLRKRTVNPSNLREAFQLISAADRVLSSVGEAGRQILDELQGLEEPGEGERPRGGPSGRPSPRPSPRPSVGPREGSPGRPRPEGGGRDEG